MAGRVIDELVTIIRYNTSNRELRRAEQQVNDFTRNTQRQFASWGQNISKITKAATVVLGALGAGAFKVGAAEDRSLLNLRTQLGLTADEVEALKSPLKGISKETNRPLRELNDAIFSVRSAGLAGADAMEVLVASAKVAASGLGDTKSIALLAGGAVNTFGSDVLSGERAVEILLGPVKEGNLNAAELANTMGKGFTFVDQLGADLSEYGASIAGYTRTAQSASAATDAVAATFRALATPSAEGAKILGEIGLSVADVRRAVKEDGFLATLDRLRTALGGNEVKLRQLLGEANAVGFALHATGEGAAEYEQILGGIRDTVGDVSKGFEIYANSSVAQADEATNNLRLALSSLYNNVLAPLLQLFGKLPSAIQTVVFGMGAMQIASTIGLGPSLGGLISSLGRFVVALKTGTIWNSNFILSLRLAAISAGRYVAGLKIATVATKIFRAVILITTGAARVMWLAIAGPIGLAIAAFALVGFAVFKFRRQIVDALKGVWNFIKDKWREIAGLLLLPILGPFALIATNAFGLRDKLIDAFTKVRDFFMGIWGTIVGIFRDHWDKALAVLFPAVGLPLLIARNWGRIVGFVGDIWSRVYNSIRGWIDAIVGIFRDHWAKILAVIFPAVGIPLLIAQEWDQIVGIVGGVWSRVYDTVKGWIEAIISFIKEIPGKVKDAVKDIPDMVTEAVKEIPVVGQVVNIVGGVADNAKGFLGGIGKVVTGAEGGVVPGPLCRPVPAIIHGGEMVLPKGASSVLAQMLQRFRLGPAALPQAPPHYGQMYRSSVTNRTVNINMNEPIVIQTQATDAKGIAKELGEAIQDQIRNIAYDHDGPVER